MPASWSPSPMCNEPMLNPRRARRQRGASIVELMIGLVISLLVGLAATGAALSFMAQQRSGVGATGVAVNTNSIMSVLRDDVASAGLGFYGEGATLCANLQLSVAGARLMDGVAFSPLQVTRQTAADLLDVMYASSVESGATVRLHEASDGSAATLKSLLPVATGQTVLLTPAPGSSATGPCLVRTVTGVVAGTPEEPRPQLAFAATGQHNAVAFTTPASFNTEARVTQLGAVQWSRYRVSGGQLLLDRPLTGASAVLARDVIAFRVRYGIAAAAAGSTSIESWVDPEGGFASLSAANAARVRAMRIGLIVRSPQRQKPDVNGNCDSTPSDSPPTLFGRAPENLPTDWTCWRYRTSELVVPLRNVAMGLR
jgi:type IV pilus assembly protein PilW